MAIALLFPDSSILYCDAVTSYVKNHTSSVSNHPIDKSAFVTDHIAKDNPKYSIKGVISAADFHNPISQSPQITGDDSQHIIDPSTNVPTNELQISDPSGGMAGMLPESIRQFLTQETPVNVYSDPFRGYFHEDARSKLQRAWEKSELITILDYDYDNQHGFSISSRQYENCLITNYQDSEDPSTGDSLEFSLQFQEVRFAYVRETDVAVSSGGPKAAQKTNRGDVTAGTSDNEEGGGGEGTASSSTKKPKPLVTKTAEQFERLVFGGNSMQEDVDEINGMLEGL